MKTRKKPRENYRYDNDDFVYSISRRRSERSSRVEKSKSTRISRRLRSLEAEVDVPEEETQVQNTNTNTNIKSPVKRKNAKTEKNANNQISLPSEYCNFCNVDATEDYLLGELKKCEDITAHTYCLFFSPNLTQNGEPHEGIDGFLLKDIRKEVKRGTHLKCTYCNKRGAVVGCKVPSCENNYHLPCGIENGAFNNFHDDNHSFPSHCKKHRPKIRVPCFKGKILCTICQTNMKNDERFKLLYFDCCQSYFHLDCLSKLAYHQGEYHVKCPNCKNDKDFVKALKTGGIYVPCRDATYELSGEMNYNDVVFECSAVVCRCSNGRNHNGDNEWELFACDRCGSNAVHVACASMGDLDISEWVCKICSKI